MALRDRPLELHAGSSAPPPRDPEGESQIGERLLRRSDAAGEARLGDPPGPRGWPVVGVLPRIWRDPLRFFLEVALECGGVARIGIGKFTLYLISSPDAIGYVFQGNPKNFGKGKGLAAAERVLGQGLATSEGELWARQQRCIQPMLRPQKLSSYLPALHALTRETLGAWADKAERGEAFDVAEEMRRLTLHQVCRLLLGANVAASEIAAIGQAVQDANEEINRSAWTLFPLLSKLPTPRNRRIRQSLAALDAIVERRIRERRAERRSGEDLLDQLIDARDAPSGDAMSDRQIRDELVTFFVAGHDTPANALAWTFHLLAEHPEWSTRVAAEAAGVLGDREPTLEDLDQLDVTERVLKESLRLFPPAWVIVRTAHADDVLDGFAVPAGAPLLLSQYVVHRHPSYWDNPETFDPDRWTPERSVSRHRFAYFPFGGGSRFCTGHGLAMVLGKLIVACAARGYCWRSAKQRRIRPRALTTLLPRGGVWIRAESRAIAPNRYSRDR